MPWWFTDRIPTSPAADEKPAQNAADCFCVRRAAGNLTQRVTPSEAEDRERYEDPLGAVPPLPFGYLNGIWKDFLDQRPRKAELWAFDSLSRREEDTGWFKRHAKARGYAWVVRGEIKQEIVVEG